MMYLKRININKICFWGLILRLLTLIIVLNFSGHLSKGLLGSDKYNQDDLRYAEAAHIYAKTANNIVDYKALENALDTLETAGTHDHGIELWYWIVSVLVYLLKNEIFVRIINILFAIVSIKCIYDICRYIYNDRIAKLAAILYAFLPYPIIFSCFLYKDQFYTMLTLLLFRKAFQCAGHIKPWDIVVMLIGLYLSQLTRSGVSVILLATMMVVIYKYGGYSISKTKLLVATSIFVAAVGLAVYLSLDTIARKVTYFFLTEYETSNSTIGFVEIRTPFQIYRYPFAYLFAMLQPINIRLAFETWFDLAGILNIVVIPVALGNILYLINIKIKKDYFFWTIQVLYLLVVLTSLGITRHQYFLQPFMMIFFACYYYKMKKKIFLKMISLAAIALVFSIWIYSIYN